MKYQIKNAKKQIKTKSQTPIFENISHFSLVFWGLIGVPTWK